MRLEITVDIDVEESGLNAGEIKNDLAQFARNLLIIGAEEQGIGLALKEVKYVVTQPLIYKSVIREV